MTFPGPLRLLGVMIVSLLLLSALPVQVDSPPPQESLQALASTSGDSRLPQDPMCRDEAIFLRSTWDVWPRVYFPQQAWMSLLGDVNGDGLFDFPNGIDALGYLPSNFSNQPTIFDLAFSTDRDFLSFSDGDILQFNPAGGLQVLFQEADLWQLLNPTSGSLDIDALSFENDQSILISLKDNLYGTVLGDLLDGDILRWNIGQDSIEIVATEAQVQAWVDHATGGAPAIGDVKSLSLLPHTGEMVFSIQAPTSADATVYGEGQGGRVLPGWSEDDWQFQISSELDALCFPPVVYSQPVVLTTDIPYLQPNTPFQLKIRHAPPQTQLLGIAGPNYQIQANGKLGLGFTVLDPSALPIHFWPGRSAGLLFSDSSGSAVFDTRTPFLPAGMLSALLWYQVSAQGVWSTPAVVKVE